MRNRINATGGVGALVGAIAPGPWAVVVEAASGVIVAEANACAHEDGYTYMYLVGVTAPVMGGILPLFAIRSDERVSMPLKTGGLKESPTFRWAGFVLSLALASAAAIAGLVALFTGVGSTPVVVLFFCYLACKLVLYVLGWRTPLYDNASR
ncbi:hypothetical protein CDG81_22305 [Actinopolyspora erythraea]|uniref:Uncharacterized protein n=1 Tax=Actinopolyspora erythraea TaxID=414996 RepID=A0A099D9C6_9ACTN|nr:hypothetical protein [Actinopolyspora erythraea]ASU80551.1 hypothetical protein CDG81_22305 [Actinopolyspora erythraea]KGI82773.1 hypothetical protein IL38_02540 [Actinopolyspora erythraea]